MADFISNSAILPLIRPTAALTAAPNSSPACEKWQTCAQTLPKTAPPQPNEIRTAKSAASGVPAVRAVILHK